MPRADDVLGSGIAGVCIGMPLSFGDIRAVPVRIAFNVDRTRVLMSLCARALARLAWLEHQLAMFNMDLK